MKQLIETLHALDGRWKECTKLHAGYSARVSAARMKGKLIPYEDCASKTAQAQAVAYREAIAAICKAQGINPYLYESQR